MPLMGIDSVGGATIHGIDEKAPKRSLAEKLGRPVSSGTPMYIDRRNGDTVQVGYVFQMGRGNCEAWVKLYRVEQWEGR